MTDIAQDEPPDYPVLAEATLIKFEGRNFQVLTGRCLLSRHVSEKIYRPYIERRAVFHATKLDDQQQVVVKFFIHQHPVLRRGCEVSRLFSGIAQPGFTWEVQALEAARRVNGFPQLLHWECTVQSPEFENPGGRINLIAMTRLPAFPLSFYIDDLRGQRQIDAIRARAVDLVEALRLHGQEHAEGDPDKIMYDPASGKVYESSA
ncbi:uncharacterized protein BO72DRAFT_524148 [Aspergillus fijiensis CBS 313.89]|uniref:Uncharacterized protein n=1 Tax=Aspergillus fijiensis CBS 313.89 TaxID=1448319 RepID=A0A8G1RZ72_9EURO|nr:uncharacterized protein BO72DRAFT_524148 [Aspergillus fijiensis CBS 313.89]RAK81718.1 hypothetical protein BO72DRAFT_524148 [Aspergillus fijiensis CBS 313.89]